MLTHLSLFSGIGGIDLAAHWAGFETVAFCEKDEFCQELLRERWPGVPVHDDIFTLRGQEYAGVTLLTGGFPCQPFSQAGKRRGSEDDRALWPEMLRVIREARPRWVVGENVAGLLSMVEFEDVCASLEGEDYEVQPIVIPACDVGAWHRRYRVFIVAHTADRGRWHAESAEIQTGRQPGPEHAGVVLGKSEGHGDAADTARDVEGRAKQRAQRQRIGTSGEPATTNADRQRDERDAELGQGAQCAGSRKWGHEGPEHRIQTGDGGLDVRGACDAVADTDRAGLQGHGRLDECRDECRDEWTAWSGDRPFEGIWLAEPSVGRVAHGVSGRVDRLKGLGNAVVPQQIYPILEGIAQLEMQGGSGS